ncbi:hypothetical protein HOK51_08545 [Candidatus Woesearchaeota archaeon]|jgi:hypothetical protein|nr:hypothetical protein [Candidatus Woesearchaeota archaeon]MBT6519875.1 hypothetical protein [Candidatus Woesearchaeota archaeon]MBT7367167.1 hypothetical protein [Candidatus Woesearchaeota archaeon]
MTEYEKKRLTLTMDAPLFKGLKVYAAMYSTTMTDVLEQAVGNLLAQDEGLASLLKTSDAMKDVAKAMEKYKPQE